MPNYPIYPTQITSGNLPSMVEMGPPDLRPSSSTAPHFQKRFDHMYGRNLAGLGVDDGPVVQDEEGDSAWAVNELQQLQHMDDTDSSGIFDAGRRVPNINPTEGVFSDKASLPGYIARERMFAPSEVSDVTTGRPVVYVPAGWTVADDASRVALMENRWNNPPQPVLASRVGSPISSVSRVAPAVASRSVTGPHNQYGLARNSIFAIPKAISGLGDLPTSTKVVVGLGLVGLVAGLYFATQGK